ncbi:MAG: putative phage-related protein [Acidobacteriota bacterium]
MANKNPVAAEAAPSAEIATIEAPAAPAPVIVHAVKAFDRDLRCRGYQFEIGKTFTHEGSVVACESGFHACENPLDTFRYYEPGLSRFCAVELTGEMNRNSEDSKIAASAITIRTELSIPEIITRSIAWITSMCCKPADLAHSDGARVVSSATGHSSASSATGHSSASSATGDRSASSATGYSSASSATGYRSASSATGYSSASSATGDGSASSATGDGSASSATGYRSASSATGYSSASSATGDAAIAINTGRFGKARAGKGGGIALCYHNENGTLRHFRCSKVGENGIKPDVFYTLSASGEFVEDAS